MLKFALVKQEVYQDLYVAPPFTSDPYELLFSTIMRIGPIGLFFELDCDFIIVKEEYDVETQFYKRVLPEKYSMYLHLLKDNLANEIPSLQFLKPGSPFPNGKFAINANEVDWSTYDVVISLNISIPSRIVKIFKNTLFCYMNGEGSFSTKFAQYGYDITLNQLARGKRNKYFKNLDFPYTFLKGDTLVKMFAKNQNKYGIFIEKNSNIEALDNSFENDFIESIKKNLDLKILFHDQEIKNNVQNLIDSKYYIKIGGRKIRGNGVIEAISAGSLAIVKKNDLIHNEICIPELNFANLEELMEIIQKLENNPNLYEKLIRKQREIVTRLFFEKPLFNLIKFLDEKRSKNFKDILI